MSRAKGEANPNFAPRGRRRATIAANTKGDAHDDNSFSGASTGTNLSGIPPRRRPAKVPATTEDATQDGNYSEDAKVASNPTVPTRPRRRAIREAKPIPATHDGNSLAGQRVVEAHAGSCSAISAKLTLAASAGAWEDLDPARCATTRSSATAGATSTATRRWRRQHLYRH